MISCSRRRFLQAGVAAGSTIFAGCLRSNCTEGQRVHNLDAPLDENESWPMSYTDAANTGHNPDASGPKDDVEVAWRYNACTPTEVSAVVSGNHAYVGASAHDGQTGEKTGGAVKSHMNTPAISDGTLYVSRHDLEARDLTSSERRWTFPTDSGTLTAPTVANGTVYVGGGTDDDPTLYAIDADDGTERWRTTTENEIRSVPAVANGTVYVTGRNTLIALDAESGEERWQTAVNAEVRRSSAAVADNTVYLGSWDGYLIALSTVDGAEAWRRTLGYRISTPVGIANGTVYAAGENGRITGLAAATGEYQLAAETDSTMLTSPAIADGVLYVGDKSHYGTSLYALDAADGTEHWQFDTREVKVSDRPIAGINGSPAVVNGLVYVVTVPGDLYALAESTGQ